MYREHRRCLSGSLRFSARTAAEFAGRTWSSPDPRTKSAPPVTRVLLAATYSKYLSCPDMELRRIVECGEGRASSTLAVPAHQARCRSRSVVKSPLPPRVPADRRGQAGSRSRFRAAHAGVICGRGMPVDLGAGRIAEFAVQRRAALSVRSA